MSIMNISGFKESILKSKLKLLGSEGLILLSIIDFIFSDCIRDLTGELDAVFESEHGRPAYPSSYVIGHFYVLY